MSQFDPHPPVPLCECSWLLISPAALHNGGVSGSDTVKQSPLICSITDRATAPTCNWHLPVAHDIPYAIKSNISVIIEWKWLSFSVFQSRALLCHDHKDPRSLRHRRPLSKEREAKFTIYKRLPLATGYLYSRHFNYRCFRRADFRPGILKESEEIFAQERKKK